jgi:hypothetical protein
MKKVFLILIAVFSFFASVAQKSARQIALRVSELHQAMIDADKTRLSALVVDSLTYGHSSGIIENKDRFIEQIVSGKSDFVSINITEQRITLSGDVAIVRHILKGTTNDAGKIGEVNLRVIQVWQKVKGGWKLFGRQAAKIL